MFQSPIRTARVSGFSREPPHCGQGRGDMNFSIHARISSDFVSR